MNKHMLPLFMDFNFKKLSHIFALLLLIFTFFFAFILPVILLFVSINTTQHIDITPITELFLLVIQLGIVLFIFVLTPFLWYVIVNNLKMKEILGRIKLVGENIDKAFLWGILAAVAIFLIIFVVTLGLINLGQKPEDLSNIPDLQSLFSWPALFFLVAIQPIGEEIFFRGFLFEKIEKYAGGIMAIFITAFLFGLAHLSYGKIFPVVMPIFMGIILGYIVLKTKSLYSSITAHVTFNITVVTLAYIGQQLLQH